MKNDLPLISIIIPVYNSSEFILNTLLSLETQSYKNFEIIIINDGSTDNSLDIIDSYRKKAKNLILYTQINSGVSVARNKGIELANGEFVVFLDSDDCYIENFLEKMLDKQRRMNADLIYCGYNKINKFGDIKKIPCLFKEGRILKSYLEKDGYFHFSGMLIRRKVLFDKDIRFEEQQTISEDLLFTVKLLNHFECYCVKEYLFNYVERIGSTMTSSWSDKEWMIDINGRKKILHYLKHNYSKRDKRDVIQLSTLNILQREISYLIDCIKRMRYEKVKSYLRDDDFVNRIKMLKKNKLRRRDEIKLKILERNNTFVWFIYTIYYRFFRFRIKLF